MNTRSLPANVPPSIHVGSAAIAWRLDVMIQLPLWPDWHEQVRLTAEHGVRVIDDLEDPLSVAEHPLHTLLHGYRPLPRRHRSGSYWQ